MFYNPIRRKKEVKNYQRFAICTVYKESSSLKNGEHYHYTFLYQGKLYDNYNSKSNRYKVNFGDRFMVEFSYQDPEISFIHYEWPISNNLVESPDSGWSKVPYDLLGK